MADLKEKHEGQPYRQVIKESIRISNWFILLLPDPRDDWDWCLFETDLFAAPITSADRLICIHHPSKKPGPIEDYNMVAAVQEPVESFLKTVFVNEDPIPGLPAINPALTDNIPVVAKEVTDAVSNPKDLKRKIYEPWVELYVENPKDLESIDKLDESIVLKANKRAKDIFMLLEKKSVWGDFRSNLIEDISTMDDQWLNDLCHVIRKIANGQKYYPVQSVFHNSEGKMFRPIVSAIDRDVESDEIEVFHLTFVEDVASVDRSAIPKDLSILANALRSAFRFRWEVLEKYAKGPIKVDDIGRLKNSLTRIQQDWDSKNLGGEKEISDIFSDIDKQNRIKEMFYKWNEVKNDEQAGTLDIALKNLNTNEIPAILESFIPINKEFLDMAADRFAEIVSQ